MLGVGLLPPRRNSCSFINYPTAANAAVVVSAADAAVSVSAAAAAAAVIIAVDDASSATLTRRRFPSSRYQPLLVPPAY